MKVVPFGDDAVLVELADLAQVRALDDAVRAARARGELPDVVDQVPAAASLLLRAAGQVDAAVWAVAVARCWEASTRGTAGATLVEDASSADTLVDLQVRYDGPDLQGVADLVGMSVEEVVGRHTAATYTVAFGGFMPGFAYLVGLDPTLRVPRRDSPRERVPAGSVAVADEFSAVYPAATPGGWQLLGTCDAALWDVHRDPPALLVPGMRVRFVRVER
ncbi:allophanate hydrolase subunit 1 [Cellulomonas sp. JH27-2]|uniref:5-oxoprolinase subunit B family protein n=1 Tax=Cellulomonas sp. JH27-2 TaxID=2774139 RepID=UPI001786F891|nr:allophanate hydrolase subunit 1 [Cellulomonas sp. JH27-2]